jgi:hypothetical protein
MTLLKKKRKNVIEPVELSILRNWASNAEDYNENM